MSSPTPAVVAAFGGDRTRMVPLAGGNGRSWRAGSIVLKPAEHERLVRWVGEFVGALQSGGFRVARPVCAGDGRWIVDGWSATEWVEGEHMGAAWDRILRVSGDFHAAAAATGMGPSQTLTNRDDPWAIGDRVAWSEQKATNEWPDVVRRLLERLAPLVSPPATEMSRQVVHGDLCGNVLFADADGLGPAVIDVSPYYRPAAWADAIVVADAIAWEAAPLTLARRYLARVPEGHHLLARAIAYRVVAAAVQCGQFPAAVDAELHAYGRLLPLLDVGAT